MVLKLITEANEKYEVMKASEKHKDCTKLEALYDMFFNKYGINKLTDKKFKEVISTIVKKAHKIQEIREFALEIGFQN